MTERGSIVEINKGLDIEGPQTMLEEVFKIMLNLEIESVLFLSVVIIVQFILRSDCVTVENQLFRFNYFCETQGLKVLEDSRLVPQRILAHFCGKKKKSSK
jgi:hypothetical protein